MPLPHSNSAIETSAQQSPSEVPIASHSVPVSPEEDDLITEKSAKIRQWVKRRLEELEERNRRLETQNLRCTEELRALTSFAENTRQWRRSALFSQSVSGTLPTWMDTPTSRTSEDSGLTSSDDTGDRSANGSRPTAMHDQVAVTTIAAAEIAPRGIPRPTLMSQSTSALSNGGLKRNPRRTNGASQDPAATPPTGDSLAASTLTNHSTTSTGAVVSASLSSAETSPSWDDRLASKPVPTPRRCPRPIMGSAFLNRIERDSLNSYAVEDDYAADEDELFDESDPQQEDPSPPTVRGPAEERRQDPRYADYVNLAEFCVVRDLERPNEQQQSSLPQYADLVRARSEQPDLPAHRPFMQWEQRLYQTAEKCLSVVEASTDHSSASPMTQEIGTFDVLRRASPAVGFNERCGSATSSSTSTRRPNLTPTVDSGIGRESGNSTSDLPAVTPPLGMTQTHAPAASSDDYALPPDASTSTQTPVSIPSASDTLPRHISRDTVVSNSSPLHQPNALRTSLIPSHEPAERSGYWTQMSESRLKSLKRRFVVLKNGRLDFYRAAKNQIRNEPPTLSLPLSDVRSISRVSTKSGGSGFQLNTTHDTLRYAAETKRASDEWIDCLNQALRQLTISQLAQQSRPECELSGWVVKVRNGHQRRVFAALLGQKLLFFKKAEDKLPCAHVLLEGARVCEKSRSSSDEYSGSSDEAPAAPDSFGNSGGSSSAGSRPDSMAQPNHSATDDFSICIEADSDAPIYLLLRSSEEREKWSYYLRIATNDPSMRGTPFELLTQRLMSESDPTTSSLWEDVLLTRPEPKPLEPLTSVEPQQLKRKAVELGVACHLFASVLMRPVAVQYHVDLAQNILSMVFENECLCNELYALLIRLTCSDLAYSLQAWKLLAMAIPLYLPRHYALLWLLKNHLHRWVQMKRDTSPIAAFCEQLLTKRQKAGDRREGPSKLEALSILTRDPSSTTLPFSVPIRLPSGDFQVIEFDGCTEIGQCLSSLCLKLGLRPALLSGYSLYASDPVLDENPLILLKNKQKLCDCLTAWERRVKDVRFGRVTNESCSIRLHLRLRHYWSHLADEETPMEKLFLCYRMAEEIAADHLPMSNELAEELCALYAQMCHGDPQQPTDLMLDRLLERFYPRRMLQVANTRSLRANLRQHWSQLTAVSLVECVRMILAVLRRWRFFGAYICRAQLKLHPENQIWIALNDQGVHLLSDKQMDVVRSFPFHRLLNFGELMGDFMLTILRVLPPNSHPEESTRERLTFLMTRESVEQLTVHLAEFIRCQRLVWKISSF